MKYGDKHNKTGKFKQLSKKELDAAFEKHKKTAEFKATSTGSLGKNVGFPRVSAIAVSDS